MSGNCFANSWHIHLYVMVVCTLRGACRARPMGVGGGPLLMGGLVMRWGWARVCLVSISAG